MVALLAVMSALWLYGLLDQLYSAEAIMRYLALSMALVAIGAWRWQPRRLRVRSRDRGKPLD
jgi:hypothetical protein